MNGSFGTNGDNGDNEWRQWMLHWRQWRFGKWRHWGSQSPLATMAIAIVANGDCDRHWRHSQNCHWRQWSIHWRHSLSPLAPMAPNAPLTKLNDTFTKIYLGKGFVCFTTKYRVKKATGNTDIPYIKCGKIYLVHQRLGNSSQREPRRPL